MSRSRGNAALPVLVPHMTSLDQAFPPYLTEKVASSNRELKTVPNAKSEHNYFDQDVGTLHRLSDCEEGSYESVGANYGRGLVLLRSLFKRSRSDPRKESRRGHKERGSDINTNETVHIVVPRSTSTKNKGAAYVPQHAASDYIKTAFPLKIAHNHSKVRRSTSRLLQEDSMTFQPMQTIHIEDHNTPNDYEKLIQFEQQATNRAAVHRFGLEPLPEAPSTTPANIYAVHREKKMSVLLSAPQKSHQLSRKSSIRSSIGERIPGGQTPPQLRRSGSLLMIVGEYIKPPRL